MRFLAASFLLAILSFTMACPTRTPVVPVDASDAAQEVTVTVSSCAQACARMRVFNCREAMPDDASDSCEVTCNHSQLLFNMHPDCVVKAKTIDDVRACGQACKQ